MSFRAVEILRSVTTVLAEDTRHSRKLLDNFGIATPMSSYHEHNEARETPRLVERLRAGESFALITDAGTPLLSDPGTRLTSAAIEAGVPVVAVPGASALLAALVVSGLDAGEFVFLGFLPRKGKERKAMVAAAATMPMTVVLYEAPGRVRATLEDLAAAGAGNRPVSVSRELTKKFEETVRGTVTEVAARFSDTEARGEFVIVLGGAPAEELSDADLRAIVSQLREEGESPRGVTDRLVQQYGVARNHAYRLAHESAESQS